MWTYRGRIRANCSAKENKMKAQDTHTQTGADWKGIVILLLLELNCSSNYSHYFGRIGFFFKSPLVDLRDLNAHLTSACHCVVFLGKAGKSGEKKLPVKSRLAQFKPLSGKVFYLDLPSNKTAESLERDIKNLGGVGPQARLYCIAIVYSISIVALGAMLNFWP